MTRSSSHSYAFAAATHPGKGREHNEDAYAVSAAHLAAVVADGMGGLARGEVASQMVTKAVIDAVEKGQTAAQGLLEAHRLVLESGLKNNAERMGSTAVTLSIRDGSALVEWIGDSRAYLWRGQALSQITRDHSFVTELIDVGAISPEEAQTHPNRNVLTRAVGIHDSKDLKIGSVNLPLKRGDRVMLCSDGLHGYLPEASIIESFRDHGANPEALVQDLIQRTLTTTDASDNITVVCAAVEE